MDQETFARLAKNFEEAKDSAGEPLRMHYLMVSEDGDSRLHRFKGRATPSDIRSLSKTVLTLIAGTVAKDDPNFNLDLPVWPYLEPLVTVKDPANQEKLMRVKVRHLLNHTVGFDEVLMMRGDIADMDPSEYLDYIVNTPLVYGPGEHYLYSNAGFYLLSVVLQEYLGVDLKAYADEHFFAPLGITECRWERYGDYLAGATRLWLDPVDLMKVGELLLAGGVSPKGERLVAEEWLRGMKQITTLTGRVDTPTNPKFRRYAYGHGLWLGAEDGIFFGHGTGGQTLAVFPKQRSIILTLADQEEVVRLEELVEEVAQNLSPAVRGYTAAEVVSAEAPLLAKGEPLMARASLALADVVEDMLSETALKGDIPSVVLLVGAGNNGGDALYAGAILARRGVKVTAVLTSDRMHVGGYQAAVDSGVVFPIDANERRQEKIRAVQEALESCDLLVDGILGTGSAGRSALRGSAKAIVQAAERLRGEGAGFRVVAVDLPSGLDPDSGALPDPAVLRADVTVTFGVYKAGLLVGDGPTCAGQIRVADIGLPLPVREGSAGAGPIGAGPIG